MYSETHIQLPGAFRNVTQHIYLKVENIVYSVLSKWDFSQPVESLNVEPKGPFVLQEEQQLTSRFVQTKTRIGTRTSPRARSWWLEGLWKGFDGLRTQNSFHTAIARPLGSPLTWTVMETEQLAPFVMG